ncbi:tenascin-R-like [Aplysia californica]|uniref:Tenascin-R-like n=1 Tax=Aplysia californica TaxID=6500 RepID=A0ABM0K408_APLCA|nr:tenascin-R-like [Aplysia californica]
MGSSVVLLYGVAWMVLHKLCHTWLQDGGYVVGAILCCRSMYQCRPVVCCDSAPDHHLPISPVRDFMYTLRRYELRVDISFNGQDYYANYDNFTLFGEAENYRIRVSGYSGNSSNGLSYHNDQPFTTKDRDNDAKSSDNCAVEYHGAWWYKTCHNSNLNGKWGSQEYGEGLVWGTTTGQYDSATFTEMKIRPLD